MDTSSRMFGGFLSLIILVSVLGTTFTYAELVRVPLNVYRVSVPLIGASAASTGYCLLQLCSDHRLFYVQVL